MGGELVESIALAVRTAELRLASLAMRRWAESTLGDGSAGLVMPAAPGAMVADTAEPARKAELTILGLAREGGSPVEDCFEAILRRREAISKLCIVHVSCLLTD